MDGSPRPDDIGESQPSALTQQDIEEVEGELVDEASGQRPTPNVLRAVQVLTAHQGPMPSEQWLTAVEELEKGTTKRIVDDFIEQRKHQRTMETEALDIDRNNFRGFQGYQYLQLAAAWSTVTLIGAGGIVLIALGHSITGFAALVGELAILAGVFIGRQILDSKPKDSEPPRS